MPAFINPPEKISLILKLGIWIAKKITKKEVLPARLLTWYPKAAISSGIMESMVAHKDKNLDKRILKLIRMQTSFIVSCPFCIDMNSEDFARYNITEEEIRSLQDLIPLDGVKSFSKREKTALMYARSLSHTPISIPSALVNTLKVIFHEREIVIIASTIAQVNYWARLIQGLGVPPEGFTKECSLLNLEKYKTVK